MTTQKHLLRPASTETGGKRIKKKAKTKGMKIKVI
jgi:hypothetical protein